MFAGYSMVKRLLLLRSTFDGPFFETFFRLKIQPVIKYHDSKNSLTLSVWYYRRFCIISANRLIFQFIIIGRMPCMGVDDLWRLGNFLRTLWCFCR